MNGFNCCRFLTPVVIAMEMGIIWFMRFLTQDTGCLIRPASFVSPYVTCTFIAMNFEAVFLLLSIFLFWYTTSRGSSYSKVCEAFIYIMIFALLANIPICLQAAYDARDYSISMMFQAIDQYYEDSQFAEEMNYTQSAWECCGVFSWKDWEINPYYNCSRGNLHSCSVIPKSCKVNEALKLNDPCKYLKYDGLEEIAPTARNMNISEEEFFTRGCLESLESYRYTLELYSIKYALILAIIPLIGMSVHKLYISMKLTQVYKDDSKSVSHERCIIPMLGLSDLMNTLSADYPKNPPEYQESLNEHLPHPYISPDLTPIRQPTSSASCKCCEKGNNWNTAKLPLESNEYELDKSNAPDFDKLRYSSKNFAVI